MTYKPRCEDIGFKHLWDVDASRCGGGAQDQSGQWHPPMRERTCVNCGKVEKWTCIKPAVVAVWAWQEVPKC